MLRIREAFRFSFRLKSYLMGIMCLFACVLVLFLLSRSVGTYAESFNNIEINATRMFISKTMTKAEIENYIQVNTLRIVIAIIKSMVNHFLLLYFILFFLLGVFVVWARTRLFVESLIHSLKDFFLVVSKIVLLGSIPLLFFVCFFRYQLSSLQGTLTSSFLSEGTTISGQYIIEIMRTLFPSNVYIGFLMVYFVYMLFIIPLFCVRFRFKDVLDFESVKKHIRAFGFLFLYSILFFGFYIAVLKLYSPVAMFIRMHPLASFWLIIAMTIIAFSASKSFSVRLFFILPLLLSFLICTIVSIVMSGSFVFSFFAAFSSILFLGILHNSLFCVFLAAISHLMAQTAYVYANGYAPTDEALRQQNEEVRRLANAEFKEKVRRASGEYIDVNDEASQLTMTRNNYFDHQRSSFGTASVSDTPVPVHPEDMVPNEIVQEPEPPVKKTGREALNEALAEVQRSRHNYFEVRNKSMTSSLPSATSAPASASNYFHQSMENLTKSSSDEDDTK